jgi:short-subunit dehydrogenase
MNFKDRTCVLTGATGGIGEAVAEQLSNLGATLILVGRNKQKLAELIARLAPSRNHQAVLADMCTVDGRMAVVAAAQSRGDVSILINNAGVSSFTTFLTQDQQEIEKILTTNLLAPILLTREIMPHLNISLNPVIVNVGSSFGSIGYPCYASYCASKFGLRGFTEALQRESANSGIQVKHFAPRATRTAINSSTAMAMNAALGNHTDEPDDVARQLVSFLSSSASRRFIGWPEKLFVRINGCLPEVVDRALNKKLKEIERFAEQTTFEGAQS